MEEFQKNDIRREAFAYPAPGSVFLILPAIQTILDPV